MAQALYNPSSDVQAEWDTTGVDHFTEIDEGTTPVLSDYVNTKSNGAIDEWGFATPSESGINFIKAQIYAETGGNATCNISLQQGGVERANFLVPVGQGQQWFSCQWDSPSGDLSALTIEVTHVKSGGGGPTYSTIYTAYLEVDYTANPVPWLAGYTYRKQIPITGQSGAGIDYQVKLEVHLGSGSDGDGVVYLTSHCQNFPDDIRFTDDDGQTELDHWLEETDIDDKAIFWIEVADDLGVNQDFYIYYGKSGGASGADGDSTFRFFDDFEGAAIDATKWDIVQGAVVQEDSLVPSGSIETFMTPSAEYYEGTYKRTYFCYLTAAKKVQIRYYDHDTDSVSSPTTLYTYGSLDSHGSPSILVLPSGKILVFWALHNSALYCRRSTNAEDISAWDGAVTVDAGDCTYPQPILLSSGDVWVFYRYNVASNHRTTCYKVSADDGGNWGGRITLADFGSGYWLYHRVAQGGNTIHAVWSKRDDPGLAFENVYYIYSPDNGVTWKTRDGTSKTPPIDEAEADLVYDTGVGEQSMIIDIKLDGSNNPFLAFIDDLVSDPSDGVFAFYDAGWETHFICAIAKTDHGTAGLIIDDDDVYMVYAGVPDAGKSEIQEWDSGDGGDNWAYSQSITDESTRDSGMPNVVKNYQSTFKLMWRVLRHFTSAYDWDFCLMAYPNGPVRSLELESTTGTRGAIEGKASTAFGYPAVLVARAAASLSKVDFTYFFVARKYGDTNETAGQWVSEAEAEEITFRTYRLGSDTITQNITPPGNDITAWLRYKTVWGGQDDAKAYINDMLVATHSTNVTGEDAVLLFWEGNIDKGVWLIDWVFARKYIDPEPMVGIAEAEEESPSAYYHGWIIQPEGELALCDIGNHPLRIHRGGTTYGVELVAIDDPNASRVRIKTPAGIKAIRKYT